VEVLADLCSRLGKAGIVDGDAVRAVEVAGPPAERAGRGDDVVTGRQHGQVDLGSPVRRRAGEDDRV